MRRRTWSVLGVCVVAGGLWAGAAGRRTTAQDAPPAGGGPEAVVDKIMDRVGKGQVDDAVAAMERPSNVSDLRDAARAKLLALRNVQLGTYHGYDVATTVRFTPRLQVLDVMGYYDQQPVLFRFQLYHPQADEATAWAVLAFDVTPDLTDALEAVREDTPNLGAGRGGRAAR